MDKLKKVLKIVGLVAALAVVAFIAYAFYVNWQIKSGNLVKANNRWYTKAEWNQYLESIKVGPQYVEAPAVNTPEEVYAKFREALLKNDIEGALNELRPDKREKYREAALNDKEKFEKWVKSLPEVITKDSIDGNHAYYDVDYGTDNKNTAIFRKNLNGVWQIDAI